MSLVLLLFVTASPALANVKTVLSDNFESNVFTAFDVNDPNVFVIDKGTSIVNVSEYFSDIDSSQFHFDSETIEINTVVIEKWPLFTAFAAAQCTVGNHTDIVRNGFAYGTTHNAPNLHPGYCTKWVTRDWHCNACKTSGRETTYTQFFCSAY